jgi:hypothetical protein
MIGRFSYVTLGLAVGALAFWFPIVAVCWLPGGEWGTIITSLLFTFILPIFCCFILELVAGALHRSRVGLSAAMVCGVWASAPFFITLANTSTAGEGFHLPGVWSFVGVATATFPISTFMLSTYNASLGAVILTTFMLPIFATREWTFQPFIRRCSMCRFMLRHI